MTIEATVEYIPIGGRQSQMVINDWGKPAGALRVVNQNILQNGLADPERGPKFKRLFQAVEGDVGFWGGDRQDP